MDWPRRHPPFTTDTVPVWPPWSPTDAPLGRLLRAIYPGRRWSHEAARALSISRAFVYQLARGDARVQPWTIDAIENIVMQRGDPQLRLKFKAEMAELHRLNKISKQRK